MWTAGSPVTANPGLHAGQTVSPLNGSQEFLQKNSGSRRYPDAIDRRGKSHQGKQIANNIAQFENLGVQKLTG